MYCFYPDVATSGCVDLQSSRDSVLMKYMMDNNMPMFPMPSNHLTPHIEKLVTYINVCEHDIHILLVTKQGDNEKETIVVNKRGTMTFPSLRDALEHMLDNKNDDFVLMKVPVDNI